MKGREGKIKEEMKGWRGEGEQWEGGVRGVEEKGRAEMERAARGRGERKGHEGGET